MGNSSNTVSVGFDSSVPVDSSVAKRVIYMDYQATTPMDPRVIEKVYTAMKDEFGNPHSSSHAYGWSSKAAVNKARSQVADLIGATSKDIIFTSGATESNNLALKGSAEFWGPEGKNHIIVATTEHKCILQTCKYLSTKGFEITYLNPMRDGRIDPLEIEKNITDKTIMISVMAVNNEIGVINDLDAIGKITRARGVVFHTDAAQGFGKIPLNVDKMNIDLMSISGHKIYGPKGIGALYVRRRPKVRILPIIHGGGQERGLRSGTLPTPLIVGLGEASRICMEEMNKDFLHISRLAKILKDGLLSIPNVILNGSSDHRWCGNINVSLSFVEGESMIMSVPGLAVSSGSACTSSTLQPSYVLHAMGVTDDLAHSSIRLGIGRFTTEDDVMAAIEMIKSGIRRLRDMSPLWEMHNNGVDISSIEWVNH